MEAVAEPAAPGRILALLKIGYMELQYWMVGLTPEWYHLQQSRNYAQLGAWKHSAHHCSQLLEYSEHSEARARLGFYYATLGRYAEAAEHYRKAVVTWPHPSILLGLAQAEVRVGNHQAAVDLLERVENSEMKEQLAALVAEVRSEL